MGKNRPRDEKEHKCMTREQQTNALTAAVLQDYAAGRIAWKQMQRRLGVTDYDLVLMRLGEEGLKIPRADPRHSELGLIRLRQAMAAMNSGQAR